MNGYMDVKTFAAAAGVSTQYVYKLLDTKLQPFVNKDSGKTMISEDGLAAVGIETPLQTVDNLLLEKLATTLQEQLSVKDEQIKALQTELSAISVSYRQLAESHVQLLNQQQQLNGMNMRLLQESEQQADEKPSEPPRKKKWWSRKG